MSSPSDYPKDAAEPKEGVGERGAASMNGQGAGLACRRPPPAPAGLRQHGRGGSTPVMILEAFDSCRDGCFTPPFPAFALPVVDPSATALNPGHPCAYEKGSKEGG